MLFGTWRKMRKLVWLLLPAAGPVQAQVPQLLTLDSCLAMAGRNFPLVKQLDLIGKSADYSLENAARGYLPRLTVAGQATYQSDVTGLPLRVPGMDIPVLGKDQYRLYGEVLQPLTDLLTKKDHRRLIEANAEVETGKVQVELYKLRERVGQLYFGILLLDAQLEQAALLKEDIESGLRKMTAAIAGGVASAGSLYPLEAESLKADQRIIELRAARTGFADMLAHFTGAAPNGFTRLELPAPGDDPDGISRPELRLFDSQQKTFDMQEKLKTAGTLPRFSLFFQGGVGRPGLNMLSNDLQGYYVGGLRLSWDISSFYTYRKDLQLVALNRALVEVQREVFLFNTGLNLRQQRAEIGKAGELLAADSRIVALRGQIKKHTQAQVENGTATANDYLIAVNAEDQARQLLVLHQVQLAQARYQYRITAGGE